MPNELIETIEKALQKARVPYSIDEKTGEIKDSAGENVSSLIYYEEDAHLIANAPEWLRTIIEDNKKLYKYFIDETVTSARFNNELQQKREELYVKDKVLEWYANHYNYHILDELGYTATQNDEGLQARSILSEYEVKHEG